MILQIFLGTLLISVTVVIHAIGTIGTIHLLRKLADLLSVGQGRVSRLAFTIIIVLWLFILHTSEVWLWAAAYWRLTDLPDFETALYFSTVSFTTLGFGDIVLEKSWRLLSALEAANGILLFGWSTAFLFAVIRRIWEAELADSSES